MSGFWARLFGSKSKPPKPRSAVAANIVAPSARSHVTASNETTDKRQASVSDLGNQMESIAARSQDSAIKAKPERFLYAKDLIDAAYRGDLKAVHMLLDMGADANSRDEGLGNNRRTVLIAATENGHYDIVMALLNRGADVNARGLGGRTALVAAALKGHLAMVRALLEKGADVNVRDFNGNSALKLVSGEQREDIVSTLVSHGAVPDTNITPAKTNNIVFTARPVPAQTSKVNPTRDVTVHIPPRGAEFSRAFAFAVAV